MSPASERAHELLHLGDAVLEQVADPPGVAGEQFGRVALLHVLGQQQHGRLRPPRDDFAEEGHAVHFRHAQIGNDERDGAFLELLQRLDAGARFRAS